jgi:DNA-binding transcriptional MerR regulator
MTVIVKIAVMKKPAANPPWTLEELSQEVETLLRRAGLLRLQGDGRVSAAPDARTVRYYATLGLIDRPELEGRVARYGRKQLLQLVAIKALQTDGLGLSDIQSRLYGRSERELSLLADQLIAKALEIEPPPPALSLVLEVALAPGLKLQVSDDSAFLSEDFSETDLEALETQFRAALAAIAMTRKGQGSKS